MGIAKKERVVSFVERAPALRAHRAWFTLMCACWLALGVVVTMFGQFLPSTPQFFGTSWGDGTLSAADRWFLAVLAVMILVTVYLALRLLPPFRGPVEVRISVADDRVSVLRGGRCVETLRLADVRGVRVGPHPFKDGPTSEWLKPTGIWAVDSFVRKNTLSRAVYLVVDGDKATDIEVAAFLARGDEGEKLAQGAAGEIEKALQKAGHGPGVNA